MDSGGCLLSDCDEPIKILMYYHPLIFGCLVVAKFHRNLVIN